MFSINLIQIRGCKSKVIVKSAAASGLHAVELLVTMKSGEPLVVIQQMIQYRLAFPASQPMRSPRGKSPQENQPMRGSPQGNQPMRGQQRGSPTPNQPMKSPQGQSPNFNQSPSNKGAFQKYQKGGADMADAKGIKSPDNAHQRPTPKKPEGPSETNMSPIASPIASNKPIASPIAPNKPVASNLPRVQAVPSNEFEGMIVWFNNPSSFYVHVASEESMSLLTTITQALNTEYANAGKSTYRAVIGDMVVSLFEGAWSRAVVQSAVTDTATILYIDFGNKEVANVSDLHRISDELRKMPILAMHCKLAGLAPSAGKAWSKEAIQFSKEKVRFSFEHIITFGVLQEKAQHVCCWPLNIFKVKAL